MSWGEPEFAGEQSYDPDFTTPKGHNGVTFVSISGDQGAGKPDYPGMSPNVVAVGGTVLNFNAQGALESETGWPDSGGGISLYESQPAYQTGNVTQSAARHAIPDLAMDAGTNVSVYDSLNVSSPWGGETGTSVGAPLFSGLIADADQARVAKGLGTLNGPTQTLPLLYTMPADNFNPITSGGNGEPLTPDYNLSVGLGSPVVQSLIQALEGPVLSLSVSGNGHPIRNTTYATSASLGTSLASAPMNSPAPAQSFTITNTGGGTLYPSIQLPNGFTLVSPPAASLAPGASTTFAVALHTVASGTFTGLLDVTASPIRNPYIFMITGTVAPALPTIGSLTAQSTGGAPSVTQGSTLVLTAHDVAASAPTTIKAVDFYSSTSATFSTANAKLIGAGKLVSANTYALMMSTKLSPGAYTFFARALDSLGRYGAAVMTSAVVNDDPPHITSLSVISPLHPAADNAVTLRAVGVSDPYDTVTSVSFYWNSAGTPVSGPDALANAVFLGTATAKTGWMLRAMLPSASAGSHPFPASGPVTFVAQAIDARNTLGNLASVTVTVAAQPTIGLLTVSPTSINPLQPVIFTAGDIADTGLPGIPGIVTVDFWLAPAGSTALNTATDTLLGSGAKQVDGDWVLTLKNFSRFPAGDYVIFANVKDRNGNWSEAIAEGVTVL